MYIKEFVEKGNSFIIFGAGGGGVRLLKVLKEMGKDVLCFLDNGKDKVGTLIEGIPVRHPDEFQSIDKEVLIASVYFREIARQLCGTFGLKSGKDMMPVFDVILLLNEEMKYCGGKIFQSLYAENRDRFTQVEQWLEDEDSRDTYRRLIQFRKKMFTPELIAEGDIPFPVDKYQEMMKQATAGKEAYQNLVSEEYRLFYSKEMVFDSYQYKDIVVPQKGDVIVEGGFWSGDTAHWFLKKTDGDCRILGFEPELKMIETAFHLIQSFPQIQVINKGLYDTDKTLFFNYFENADNDSFVSETEGNKHIEVCRLDTFVKENGIEKVDFIKLDVEGAEIQALEGARESILKYKPDLAVCIYHKGRDFIDIPFLIKEMNPEYTLYLSHKDITPWETVLFATVRG